MIRAELYEITYIPTGQTYYGSTWSKDNTKTHVDRFDEHMTKSGGVYITQLLESGASRNDFEIKLLLVGDPEYVCNIEQMLSKDNLWPVGLNGNAGKNIIRTPNGQKKVSDAVSKAKKGITKEISAGVRAQISKLKNLKGELRTIKQKEWDAKKSALNKANGNRPPVMVHGTKKMNNGTLNKFVPAEQIQEYLNTGWNLGSCKPAHNKGKKIPNMKPREIVVCPHCGKLGNISQMKRWHYDNCKSR